jgi:hypothetical protein
LDPSVPSRALGGMPNVIAGLELRREWLNRAAFSVVRRSLSPRCAEQQDNEDGNESRIFHRGCAGRAQEAGAATVFATKLIDLPNR